MNHSGLVWEDNIFECVQLEKDQIILYDRAIDNENSCLLKVAITPIVSLLLISTNFTNTIFYLKKLN